jgi:vacuolar-type H+-ATPase subunit H
MTREIGIRKDGDWGKQLFELRAKASHQMARIHEVTRQLFWQITPEGGDLKRRVGAPPKPGDPDFVRAEALAGFLIITKDDAGRAAVGKAHNDLIADMRERLEAVGQDLLASLRNASEAEADEVQTRLGEIAQLMVAIGQKEASQVLLRRVAAALAA